VPRWAFEIRVFSFISVDFLAFRSSFGSFSWFSSISVVNGLDCLGSSHVQAVPIPDILAANRSVIGPVPVWHAYPSVLVGFRSGLSTNLYPAVDSGSYT
jgi:hypothetical protein